MITKLKKRKIYLEILRVNYLNRLIADFIETHPRTDKKVLAEIVQFGLMAYCLGVDSDIGIIRYVEGNPESEVRFKTITSAMNYTKIPYHKIYRSINSGSVIKGYNNEGYKFRKK